MILSFWKKPKDPLIKAPFNIGKNAFSIYHLKEIKESNTVGDISFGYNTDSVTLQINKVFECNDLGNFFTSISGTNQIVGWHATFIMQKNIASILNLKLQNVRIICGSLHKTDIFLNAFKGYPVAGNIAAFSEQLQKKQMHFY